MRRPRAAPRGGRRAPTCGSKYGSPTGHSPSARTGARYGHGAGISSTGSSPIAMIRSALASSGASIVAPVSDRPPALPALGDETLRPVRRKHRPRCSSEEAPQQRPDTERAPTPSANTGRLLEASRRAAAGRSPRGGRAASGGSTGAAHRERRRRARYPRWPGGDADRRVDRLLGTIDADRDAPLGHRGEQRILVEPLVRDPEAVRERDRIADQEHRLPIEHRVCHAVDGARHPGPRVTTHAPGARSARRRRPP